MSPEVNFNPTEKKFRISGWSRPESPSKFYEPVKKWIEEYGEKYLNNASIDFNLEYFDTPSARVLRDVMEQLETLYRRGTKVSINWHYDDEDSKEEFDYEFAKELTIPIHFVEKK